MGIFTVITVLAGLKGVINSISTGSALFNCFLCWNKFIFRIIYTSSQQLNL